MKKTHYLYADFETTTIDLKETPYDNYKDYFLNTENPKTPEVYSWNVLYDKSYKDISRLKPKIKKYKLGNFRDEVKHHYGIDGKSFIKFAESLETDCIMYFNNLRGFDGHFIIPILDKMGYENILPFELMEQDELTPEIQKDYYDRVLKIKAELLKRKDIREKYESLKKEDTKDASKYLLSHIKRKWKLVQPNQYSVITNGQNKIFEIKIGLKSNKTTKGNKRNRALIFRDNMHMFPASIAGMGETLAKHHLKDNYPNIPKTIIKDIFKQIKNKTWESNKHTPEEHIAYSVINFFGKKELEGGYTRSELYKNKTELKNDGNELEYLIQDTYILYKFHQAIEKDFPRKDWKLTIGGTSYNEWLKTFGDKLVNNLLEKDKLDVVHLKRGAIRYKFPNEEKVYSTKAMGERLIGKILPTRWLENEHNENLSTFDYLYKWFGGGITFVNDEHRGKLMTNLTYCDLNSSYPAQMVKDVKVPYGRGIRGNKKGYNFKLYKLVPKKRIHNKNGLPFLFNELSEKREYASTLEPFGIYRFSSISLENFYKYYDAKPEDYTLTIEYSFKSMSIKTFFEDFISHWYSIKELASKNGDEFIKFIAKLFINNLFGKMGTKMERISKYWNQHTTEWVEFKKTLPSKYYLPLAIVITELGRKNLVDGTGENYKDVVYGDTDSLVIKDFKAEKHPAIKFDETELGKWDIEFANGYGIFRRAKQYFMLNDKGESKIAYSGINFNKFMMSDKELRELADVEKEYRKVSLSDYITGKKISKQLTPYRLLGSGIILQESMKSIKPIWDYDPLPHQTRYKQEHFLQTLIDIDKYSATHSIQMQ